jgi:hypothetical protein
VPEVALALVQVAVKLPPVSVPEAFSVSMFENPPETPVIVPPNSLVAPAALIVGFDSAAPCSVSVPPSPPSTAVERWRC